MKFRFELSPEGMNLFSQAKNNEQREADEYLKSLGITKETKVVHRTRVYTKLFVKYREGYSLWIGLYGHRIKNDGSLGLEEHIWDSFEVTP